jgi:hypothetical protein
MMEDEKEEEQGSTFKAYDSPGEERLRTSTSPAAPVPSKTSGERHQAPDPYLSNLGGATPGSDNPALDHTRNHALGQASTADLLRAREAAEEEYLRRGGSEGAVPNTPIGQDQLQGLRPDEFQDRDAGRPNWPDDRQQAPLDYMDSPRADMPLASGSADTLDMTIKPRMDAAVDRASTQASAQESRSGLAPVGMNAEEDKYEQREFERPAPVSETEMMAPKMKNIPSEDEENG